MKKLTKAEHMLATHDWTPVLHGAIYCSPACGGNCTKRAHDKAVEAADKLVAILGSQWSAVVYENLGWYYKAVSGPVTVFPSYDGSFGCFISSDTEMSGGGSSVWTISANNSDPVLAGLAQLDSAVENVGRLLRSVFAAGRALGKSPHEIWPHLLHSIHPDVKGDNHE
jgi:hypothetical protein